MSRSICVVRGQAERVKVCILQATPRAHKTCTTYRTIVRACILDLREVLLYFSNAKGSKIVVNLIKKSANKCALLPTPSVHAFSMPR